MHDVEYVTVWNGVNDGRDGDLLHAADRIAAKRRRRVDRRPPPAPPAVAARAAPAARARFAALFAMPRRAPAGAAVLRVLAEAVVTREHLTVATIAYRAQLSSAPVYAVIRALRAQDLLDVQQCPRFGRCRKGPKAFALRTAAARRAS